MSFEDDLKAEFEAEKPHRNVDVKLNDKLYTLRFTVMDGIEWTAAGDMFPPRPGVLLDTRYGYNLRPLTLFVASKTGQRVDGEKLTDLTPDQWSNLFKALPGKSVSRIGDALFDLNEYTPGAEVEALKKARAAESAQGSSLPSDSGSLPAG
jgi:hypothetical protein